MLRIVIVCVLVVASIPPAFAGPDGRAHKNPAVPVVPPPPPPVYAPPPPAPAPAPAPSAPSGGGPFAEAASSRRFISAADRPLVLPEGMTEFVAAFGAPVGSRRYGGVGDAGALALGVRWVALRGVSINFGYELVPGREKRGKSAGWLPNAAALDVSVAVAGGASGRDSPLSVSFDTLLRYGAHIPSLSNLYLNSYTVLPRLRVGFTAVKSLLALDAGVGYQWSIQRASFLPVYAGVRLTPIPRLFVTGTFTFDLDGRKFNDLRRIQFDGALGYTVPAVSGLDIAVYTRVPDLLHDARNVIVGAGFAVRTGG